MWKGYVLRYLGAVAAGASLEDALDSLPAVVRPVVRWRAERARIAVTFDTEHAADVPHVHRLAYLRVLRQPAPNADDKASVHSQFSAARRTDVEERALVRALLVGGTTLAVGGIIVAALVVGPSLLAARPEETTGSNAPTDATSDPEPPLEPAHPLAEVFEQTLPAYSVALDARSAGQERAPPRDVAGARASLLEGLEAEEASLVPAVERFLDISERYSDGDEEVDHAGWLRHLVDFHDALRERDVPFYVDGQLVTNLRTGRRRILLSTFDVHRRRLFQVGDQRIEALEMSRLDRLNHQRSLLGYTRPEVRYALVLVDRIERFLIEQLLPSVHSVSESVIVRHYHDETGTEWVTPFETWAHEDLRADAEQVLSEALGLPRGLAELAKAVVDRKNAIIALNFSLRRRDVALREPRSYRYELPDIGAHRSVVDAEALRSLRAAERELASELLRDAWAPLRDAIVLSIARHEVQHRLDYTDDRLVQVPAGLAAYTGVTESEDRVNRRAERANAELSAYLSQVAQSPKISRTSLIHVLSFAMDRNAWSKPEAYAAVALFEALASEAGISHGPLIERRRIVRRELARIYGALREREEDALAELASRAWTRLYGAELPRIE